MFSCRQNNLKLLLCFSYKRLPRHKSIWHHPNPQEIRNTKYSFQHFITTHYVYFPVFFVFRFLSLLRANTFLAFNPKREALPISRKSNTDKIHIKSFELVKSLDGKWMLNCLHLAQEEKVPFLNSKPFHLCK